MKPSEQIQIQNAATSLQVKLWKERSRIWRIPPGIDDLIPIPVEIIVTELLRVRLEEPEEIPSDNPAAGVKIEIAGFMDRSGGRIVVAQKFPREWCRFTIAHEIAHWVLHPGVGYHRDRPLSGGERANPHRPPEEQSADLFAAELLMPTRVLRRYFHDRFGGPIDGREPNDELAFWLSAGNKRTIDALHFAAKARRYRSLVISETSSFRGKVFTPLAQRFGVSKTAMAIQLEDLDLVM